MPAIVNMGSGSENCKFIITIIINQLADNRVKKGSEEYEFEAEFIVSTYI